MSFGVKPRPGRSYLTVGGQRIDCYAVIYDDAEIVKVVVRVNKKIGAIALDSWNKIDITLIGRRQ